MDNNQQVYNWKVLINETYEEISTDFRTYDIDTSKLSFFKKYFLESEFIISFESKYTSLIVSEKLIRTLTSLLKNYNLESHLESFLILASAFQHHYITQLTKYENRKHDTDQLLKDFMNEGKDLEPLFVILHKFLNGEIQMEIHSISFKFNSNPKTLPIKNFFITQTIYKAICDKLELTLENFEHRKVELINNTNITDFRKTLENIKQRQINGLFKFISFHNDDLEKSSTNLKFIGCFLTLCQIPVNTNRLEIPSTENISEMFSTEDLKNLRHYFGRKSFSLR
ncbi:hypothetical protein [Flavobacterium sp. ZS1P14]|uniref:hypothetical protein n=1 Tax=Flavobacterium sp. ZS1P14 TaxID=3401729 RepID=UPI003AAAFD69